MLEKGVLKILERKLVQIASKQLYSYERYLHFITIENRRYSLNAQVNLIKYVGTESLLLN